ncbi:lipoprotein [Streptomyces chiangmaiensis]
MRGAVERGAVGAALAALVLSGGAVACSKGGAEESPRMTPAAAVAEAAKNADQITSMHYRLTGTVPGEGRVSGEARMSMEPLAMAMKMTAEDQSTDGPVEVRLVDKAMYIGGAAAAKEMNGKSWIKFDLAALGADKELNADQLGAGQADRNPAQESTFLTGSKRVTKVGTETVGGVRTTHYKGDVTVDEMRASLKKQHLDKTTLERREKSLDQYEKMGAGTITMDMWIDGSDHTKQFRTRSDTDKGVLDMTITFLDFNKPVSVTAPPAKDTLSLADMMKSAQQG